ncbi:vacuolar sorting-associated 13A-like, partial [Paramuricea clavata]
MVFESYVVSILNKFLGQYVENLDASQFQMSIWGGDVKLENLVLKENALDELDLPVKVLRGHLGQLILKIPWKNLYLEPVVAKVDGVYLLARPNTDIKYNEVKEEKIKQEKKQQELTAIEEAIKYAEEAKNKSEEEKEKNLSFAEKLAMHIVKNIQVFVSNIHIRYEDTLSNEDGPFSVGITLENLSAESVDDNWQPVVVDSKQSLVNK